MSAGVTITLIICATIAVVWIASMITAVYVSKLKNSKDEKHEDETELSD